MKRSFSVASGRKYNAAVARPFKLWAAYVPCRGILRCKRLGTMLNMTRFDCGETHLWRFSNVTPFECDAMAGNSNIEYFGGDALVPEWHAAQQKYHGLNDRISTWVLSRNGTPCLSLFRIVVRARVWRSEEQANAGRHGRPAGIRYIAQANWASSVEPVSAVTEDWPDWITCTTLSK